jgi:hypothetical protein
MDSANWLSGLGQAARLFVASIPDAFWLSYYWAKEWQVLLGALLVIVAAKIFAQGSLRASRIRSAAAIRAAQIAAGVAPAQEDRADAVPPTRSATSSERPGPSVSPEHELIQKIEQLRSLIRSAMFTLTTDEQRTEAGFNPYCERIAQLRFDEKDLPANPTASTLELYKKLLLQLAAVRRANERKLTQTELSQALVQLNARAREFAASLVPSMTPTSAIVTPKARQIRA